jgi:hypothetical protein
MLFSECESIEHMTLPAGTGLRLSEGPGVQEMVIVLRGSLSSRGDHPPSPHAATSIVLPRGDGPFVLTADGESEVLRIRVLPDHVSRALPERVPELREGAGTGGGEVWKLDR